MLDLLRNIQKYNTYTERWNRALSYSILQKIHVCF